MTESKDTRVHLPEIDASSMRICLEFFYTDSVRKSSWQNTFLAMKVAKAAMFFLVGRLERLALEYIDDTTSSKILDNSNAEWCKGLIPAYNLAIQLYPAHMSKDEKDVYCHMRRFLNTFRTHARSKIAGCSSEQLFSGCKHERLFYKSISELALAHFIEERDTRDPLSHYFSFLHVVRWSASRLVMADPSIDEDELEEVLNKCFLRSSKIMGSVLSSSTADTQSDDDANVSRFVKLIIDPLAQCLQRIPLNFAKIPTQILCRFIEPLDVIPSSTLLKAYRCQAFARPDLQWDQLGHGSSYSIDSEDATVICYTGKNPKGFARCSTYLNANSDAFFGWEVVKISEYCKDFRVGFCLCKPSFKASDCNTQVLGEKPGTWALCADGRLRHTDFSSKIVSSDYVDAFHSKIVSIQVHLDMVSRRCSFSIDGKDAGLAWEDLPISDHAVYPAISLERGGKAQIRMAQRSWMDRPSKRLCIANLEVTPQASGEGF